MFCCYLMNNVKIPLVYFNKYYYKRIKLTQLTFETHWLIILHILYFIETKEEKELSSSTNEEKTAESKPEETKANSEETKPESTPEPEKENEPAEPGKIPCIKTININHFHTTEDFI